MEGGQGEYKIMFRKHEGPRRDEDGLEQDIDFGDGKEQAYLNHDLKVEQIKLAVVGRGGLKEQKVPNKCLGLCNCLREQI